MWLFSRNKDLLWLFIPVWLTWGLCFLMPESVLAKDLPLWGWVLVVLGIDVSHVWSTIYRTYTDRQEFQNHRWLLILTPPLVFLAVFGIAQGVSNGMFWRMMAYLALYHFIKQQYGFLMLYRAKSGQRNEKGWDSFVIYLSMLWPVLFWHLDSGRNFNWFAENDFLRASLSNDLISTISWVGNSLYWMIIGSWVGYNLWKKASFGKILWTVTTALNWWLGIVYFNSDVAFSLTNVIAHGIPYMTLVFYYQERKGNLNNSPQPIKKVAVQIGLMLLGIFVLAFGEEYLWDLWLNRNKQAFFGAILSYPMEAIQNPIYQSLALALLSIPQVSHYVIDGFIWKKSPKNPYLPKVFSSR